MLGRRHREECVRGRKYAALNRYLVRNQTIGIASAVKAFVVRSNNWRPLEQCRCRPENAGSALGVQAQNRVFIFRKRLIFVHDAGSNAA